MASIFTFDPDPPRVSSPWRTPPIQTSTPEDSNSPSVTPSIGASDIPITRLEAEQQEGPTEYKLHLLLRPRRSFSTSTTAGRLAGSQRLRPFTSQVAADL